jgi:hypothetical protein
VASTDKDLPLKVKVAAVFRRMGYIAFSEVDLCTYTYKGSYKRKQITDFDVLGVRIDPDLEAFIAVAECKSVQDRAMEHLLKLHGVQQFFKAQKAYFVQQKIDVNAREVGAQMGVTCLDASNLDRVLKSLSIEEDDVALERHVYDIRSSMLGPQKQQFVRQIEYLKYDFWTLPDHRNIINIARLLEQMASSADPTQPPHVVLCHQLSTALAIAILRMSGGIVRSNIDDHQEAVLTAILGGSRERRDREVLHDTVARVVPDANFSLIPEFLVPLAELSGRYINAMTYSHRVVACLDEMSRRAVLGAKSKGLPAIGELFHERTIKLARDAFFFTTEVARIPREMFAVSLSE